MANAASWQRFAAVLIAVCAVSASGCGEEAKAGPEEREVRAALRDFVRHLADRDYGQVCRMMTREVKADWAQFARRNPKHFSTAGCSAFARDFYGAGKVDQRTLGRDTRAIERGSVQVRGNQAIFTADRRDKRAGKDDTTRLTKVGGRWLLGD